MKKDTSLRQSWISILLPLTMLISACGTKGVTPTNGSSNPLTYAQATGAVADELCLAGDNDDDLRCDETEMRSDNVDCSDPDNPAIDSRACMLDQYHDGYGVDDPSGHVSPWLKVAAIAAGASASYIIGKGVITGVWNPFSFTNSSGNSIVEQIYHQKPEEVITDAYLSNWRDNSKNHMVLYTGIKNGPITQITTKKGVAILGSNTATCLHGVDIGVEDYNSNPLTYKLTLRIPKEQFKKNKIPEKGTITNISEQVFLNTICNERPGIYTATSSEETGKVNVTFLQPKDWGEFALIQGSVNYELNLYLDFSHNGIPSSLPASNNIAFERFNKNNPDIKTGEYFLNQISQNRTTEYNNASGNENKIKALLSTTAQINDKVFLKMNPNHGKELIATNPAWINAPMEARKNACEDYKDYLSPQDRALLNCAEFGY